MRTLFATLFAFALLLGPAGLLMGCETETQVEVESDGDRDVDTELELDEGVEEDLEAAGAAVGDAVQAAGEAIEDAAQEASDAVDANIDLGDDAEIQTRADDDDDPQDH